MPAEKPKGSFRKRSSAQKALRWVPFTAEFRRARIEGRIRNCDMQIKALDPTGNIDHRMAFFEGDGAKSSDKRDAKLEQLRADKEKLGALRAKQQALQEKLAAL